jgi:hypothetical protein
MYTAVSLLGNYYMHKAIRVQLHDCKKRNATFLILYAKVIVSKGLFI